MKNRKDTAFTVELLGLFILLITVITIVSAVFVMCRSHSLEAAQLNEAVILAQSAAEVSSDAPDDEALADSLHDMDNNTGHSVTSRVSSEEAGSWNAFFAAVKKDGNAYIVCVTRRYPEGTPEERSDGGAYAEDTIEVYAADGFDAEDIGTLDPSALGEPIYTLVAGRYFTPDSYGGEGGAS